MQASEVQSKRDLPTDPEKLRAFSWELILSYQKLAEKYQKLLHNKYGRSSEKLAEEIDALQVEMDALLNDALMVEQQDETSNEETIEIPAHRRRRKHPGRNAIPEELITDVLLDVPQEEKKCDCGRDKKVIDTKKHIVVERIPARYEGKRYLRPVFACPHCKDTVSVAEPVVLPISKGLAGPQLLSFVVLSKYLYHLTLYRVQRQIFHESRIWFTRSTLVSWVSRVCESLERIHRALLVEYQQSRIKHADESPIKVKHDGHLVQGWMWAGLSGNGRTAVFLYDRHRSGKAAMRLLGQSRPGDYLMVDDFSGYPQVIKSLKLEDMRCMIHIRRNFVEARRIGQHVDYHTKILIKIGQLYRMERFATKKGLSCGDRGILRDKYSREILKQIKSLLMNPDFAVLPSTNTGKAINYFLRNWEQATKFLDSGELPIDNSADERIIRHMAIGRNNWGHAGSPNGAKWMAILYSIITTCKINDIDPHEYLADVLMRLAIRPEGADVTDLTPVEWYKTRNCGKEPKATPLYPSKN
jgi:transposase